MVRVVQIILISVAARRASKQNNTRVVSTTFNFAAMMIWDIYPADSERGDSLCEVSKRLSGKNRGAVKKRAGAVEHLCSMSLSICVATCDNAKM